MTSNEFVSSTNSNVNYLLDNAAPEASVRLAALAELYDPGTQRHLAACGLSSGWRCLEIGAGGGSIARWLADRVGPAGAIVATDIDTRHLRALNDSRIQIWQHNLATDPLPEQTFDLIHARLVLVHLPERDKALGSMVRALKPGGWLVVEEFDSDSMPPDPSINAQETFLETHRALARFMSARDFDRRYGRLLHGKLRAQGLVSLVAEGRVFMCPGGSAGTTLLHANFEQLRDSLIARGDINLEQFNKDLATLNSASLLMPSSILWCARGQRPDET